MGAVSSCLKEKKDGAMKKKIAMMIGDLLDQEITLEHVIYYINIIYLGPQEHQDHQVIQQTFVLPNNRSEKIRKFLVELKKTDISYIVSIIVGIQESVRGAMKKPDENTTD